MINGTASTDIIIISYTIRFELDLPFILIGDYKHAPLWKGPWATVYS